MKDEAWHSVHRVSMKATQITLTLRSFHYRTEALKPHQGRMGRKRDTLFQFPVPLLGEHGSIIKLYEATN